MAGLNIQHPSQHLWLLGHKVQLSLIGQGRPANWIVAIISSVVAIAGMFAIFKFGGDYLKAQGQTAETVQMAQMVFMPLYATVVTPALFRLLGISAPAD